MVCTQQCSDEELYFKFCDLFAGLTRSTADPAEVDDLDRQVRETVVEWQLKADLKDLGGVQFHLLLHVVEAIRKWGPAIEFWCFRWAFHGLGLLDTLQPGRLVTLGRAWRRAEAFYKYIKDQKTQQRWPEANIVSRVSLATAVDIVVAGCNDAAGAAAAAGAGGGGVVVGGGIRLSVPRVKFTRRVADRSVPLGTSGTKQHTQQEAFWKGLWLADARVRGLYVRWEEDLKLANSRRPRHVQVKHDKPVRVALDWVLGGDGEEYATEQQRQILEEIAGIERTDVYECCRYQLWYHRTRKFEKRMASFNAGVWRTVSPTARCFWSCLGLPTMLTAGAPAQYLDDNAEGSETRWCGECLAFHHVNVGGRDFVLAEVLWYNDDFVKEHPQTGLAMTPVPVKTLKTDPFVSVVDIQGKFFYGEYSTKRYNADGRQQRVRVLMPWWHLHQQPPRAPVDEEGVDEEGDDEDDVFVEGDDDDGDDEDGAGAADM